jgi:glycerol-3-phosphate dehydrogenase
MVHLTRCAWRWLCGFCQEKRGSVPPYHQVKDLVTDGKGNICGAEVWDRTTDSTYQVRGDIVVNATGAWAGEITKMAKAKVSITPTPGVMVAYDQRLINRVLNRLIPPATAISSSHSGAWCALAPLPLK